MVSLCVFWLIPWLVGFAFFLSHRQLLSVKIFLYIKKQPRLNDCLGCGCGAVNCYKAKGQPFLFWLPFYVLLGESKCI